MKRPPAIAPTREPVRYVIGMVVATILFVAAGAALYFIITGNVP